MEYALFLNGVYEDVLEEIIKAQENNLGQIFYLQPYSTSVIKKLQKIPPSRKFPIPLYISTTNQLNNICYIAEIVGWDNKSELLPDKTTILNEHIKKYQPQEGEIYFEVGGKKCVNLISIINLKKLSNQLSSANLIKESDKKPLRPRTRSGGWSYVQALTLLSIENSIVKEYLDTQFEEAVSQSLADDSKARKSRLENAPKFPEKVQTVSYSYKRNPDVVAEVLKRANGKCELCQLIAPFTKASDGSPYLEVHHWTSLSEKGKDTIDNAGALCPNCHKQAHFGKHREYIQINKALPSNNVKPRN